MAPLSLKIVQDNGIVTKKVKLDPAITVREAHAIVREKTNVKDHEDTYGLFLRSIENDVCGVWMEEHRSLSYYMLRDGDRLDYMSKIRNLRIKMLDDSVHTLKVDQSNVVGDLMINICSRLGITNHEEYGLCLEEEEGSGNAKEKGAGNSGTLCKNKKSQLKDRDLQFEKLIDKLKTDDNVEWLDSHKTLSEACVAPERTVLLKRRLFYSDRNVDSRDPVQLNLLYVQTRDNILDARHPVTEEQAADCKVRWINIRDVHRRILRKSLSVQERPRPRAYKYDKQLEFMKNFYKEVVTTNAMSDEEGNDDDDKNSEVWNDVVIECNNESDVEDEKPLKKPKRSKRTLKVSKFEEVDVSTASVANETLTYDTDYDASDPVDAFLLSIGATLKKFSPYHLNLAKSKIFHIVQEHDLQQIVEKQQGRLDCSVSTSSEPVYYQG